MRVTKIYKQLTVYVSDLKIFKWSDRHVGRDLSNCLNKTKTSETNNFMAK